MEKRALCALVWLSFSVHTTSSDASLLHLLKGAHEKDQIMLNEKSSNSSDTPWILKSKTLANAFEGRFILTQDTQLGPLVLYQKNFDILFSQDPTTGSCNFKTILTTKTTTFGKVITIASIASIGLVCKLLYSFK